MNLGPGRPEGRWALQGPLTATTLLRRLYPAKPKSHYMLHLPQMVDHVGFAANCFTPERRHKWLREQSELRFRAFEQAVVNKLVCASVEQWRGDGPVAPPRLLGPTESPEAAGLWSEVFGPCTCWGSTAADLLCGGARRGDLLLLAGGEAAWAVGFWQVRHAGGQGLFACVQLLRLLAPGQYVEGPGETIRLITEAAG